ncbi:acyl-CoA dehydrogenase family protein [Oceanobacillus picturae]|uniref:acyl-CoA dehydrogenase family protein n=1 Tax=Oceanobacillus picturae TaxID=171693 RepID=UPI000E678B09|nr:acyl-CoA dehydrogenase family protein [Oceanobacillus picturae]RIU91204.1 isovaleryl-CoA dehydrogenase [Oceanobacillus picturae]
MKNYYHGDPNLKQILQDQLPQPFWEWADKELGIFGELCAGPIDERAVHTDREGQPTLIRYNKMGEEISEVWLNEGYRQTVEETYNTGIVAYVHKEIPALKQKGNYVYAFAQAYLLSHAEAGFYCPVTLSQATAYLIDHYASEDLQQTYLPHVLSTGEVELYEGATFLTERQGGSDVGANEVKAVPNGKSFRISGEKYFASNAGACGLAMVLARMDGAPEGTKGLSLFLVPWEENRKEGLLRIRRLKDKLGVRAVPSAEVEFSGAKGFLVGEPNKGIGYMMEALNLSRVANAVASLGIMKRAYLESRNYARNRPAFGKPLTHYPMVQDTLSKMAAKQEVELNTLFHVIQLMDKVMGKQTKHEATEEEQILFRLYVAIVKKETAEQAIHFAHEAIEMHGGNGYIEDFVTPRLLRDAQVLTVWEGTANILGLEVVRLIEKYHVDTIFIEEMKKRLANINEKSVLSEWVTRLEEELSSLIQQITLIRSSKKQELQTYYSKDIAHKFAILLESVIAMETAVKRGNREEAVAEVYLQHTWNKGEMEADPVTLEYFQIICG